MRSIIHLTIASMLLAAAASAAAAQGLPRGVKAPRANEDRFDCPGVATLPATGCCRVAILINAGGKTQAARATCTLPEAVSVVESCQLPRTYKLATKFGKPIPFLTEIPMALAPDKFGKIGKPDAIFKTCEILAKPVIEVAPEH